MQKHKPNKIFQWQWTIGQKTERILQFNQKRYSEKRRKVTQAIAKAFAESEFEKYRIIQDKLFESDFDKAVKRIDNKKDK